MRDAHLRRKSVPKMGHPKSRWRVLFEAGAGGNVFAEGGQDGLAAFFARGEKHAVGFQTAHFARGEVGNDHDLAADQVLGCVPLGDAGEDLTLFVAEVDFEAEELVGFRDALSYENLGYAELDFDEVVDGDLRTGIGGAGGDRCLRGRGSEWGAWRGFGVRRREAVVCRGCGAAGYMGAGVGFGEVAGWRGGV